MENFYRAQSTFAYTFGTAQHKINNNNAENKIQTKGTNLVLPDNSDPHPVSTSSPRNGTTTMKETRAKTDAETRTTKPRPSSSRSKSRFDSRDMDRRKRIATYKMYGAEGDMKRSFKKGIRWVKCKCSKFVYGY